MGRLTEQRASFDQILSEHHELQHLIQELRRYVERPLPPATVGTLHAWASVLAGRLVALHDKLFLHFLEEERAGILEELAREFPRAGQAVDRLRYEHGQVLGEVREILSVTMTYAEDRPPQGASVSARTMSLLERLDRHERRETDLIEQLYCQELGGEHY